MPSKPPSGRLGCGVPQSATASIIYSVAFGISAALVGLIAAVAYH